MCMMGTLLSESFYDAAQPGDATDASDGAADRQLVGRQRRRRKSEMLVVSPLDGTWDEYEDILVLGRKVKRAHSQLFDQESSRPQVNGDSFS